MADPRHQLDDHEAQHRDRRDSEHVGEALALAEGGAGVPDEPQCEQPTQQPNRSKRLQLGHRDDLGDEISCQPGDSDDSDEKRSHRRRSIGRAPPTGLIAVPRAACT